MRLKLLFGLPVVVIVLLAAFTLTPCVATCGDSQDVVTEAIRRCPRAVALLGTDAKPARLGIACGGTETQGGYGRASWTLPYTGSKGRGSVSYAAQKKGGDWELDAATLEVDDETIDLVGCNRGKRPAGAPPGMTLAQTNADAATAKFEGKVLRSTHPTIPVSATCQGELSRERGSPFARVKVTCNPGTAESATPIAIYEGTGNFTLDVQDPSKREDDRSEFDDAKTTDVDKTPGCRLSSANAKGTLTIWDSTPQYELVIEL